MQYRTPGMPENILNTQHASHTSPSPRPFTLAAANKHETAGLLLAAVRGLLPRSPAASLRLPYGAAHLRLHSGMSAIADLSGPSPMQVQGCRVQPCSPRLQTIGSCLTWSQAAPLTNAGTDLLQAQLKSSPLTRELDFAEQVCTQAALKTLTGCGGRGSGLLPVRTAAP